MKHLFIIRGISGAGKSTLAQTLVPAGRDIATDDFFHEDQDRSKPYEFDRERIFDGSAHGWCESKIRELLSDDTDLPVAVANTFCEYWEFYYYVELAKELGVQFTVCSLFDGGCTDQELFGRNAHGTPLSAIASMRERFEHDWKVGDPVKPWMRKK